LDLVGLASIVAAARLRIVAAFALSATSHRRSRQSDGAPTHAGSSFFVASFRPSFDAASAAPSRNSPAE